MSNQSPRIDLMHVFGDRTGDVPVDAQLVHDLVEAEEALTELRDTVDEAFTKLRDMMLDEIADKLLRRRSRGQGLGALHRFPTPPTK